MFGFVKRESEKPTVRPARQRIRDFKEIADRYRPDKAAEQAERCSQCGTPFCQVHCPLHNNIPDWLLLAANGRLEEAYELSAETNTFPEICGRICPQDRLCEGNCVIETSKHGAVTIGAVETYLTETAFEQGWVKSIPTGRQREQSVGIVGSGPCGLAAAERLRVYGYQVHIYERQDRAGGLLTYGIPDFKLDKGVVERRLEWIKNSGIHIELECEIGKDISLARLRSEHQAVLLAGGVYCPRKLEVNAHSSSPVIPALEYLVASNRRQRGDVVPDYESGRLNAYGKRVMVIGGGDTAMDCVRTAVRQSARSVTCCYRRDRASMPGSQTEVTRALEEGIHFEWQSVPLSFPAPFQVELQRTQVGSQDHSGRRAHQPLPGSEFVMEADLIIEALGFIPENLPILLDAPGLKLTPWGTPSTGAFGTVRSMVSSLDGVFVGGDIRRGASLVVWAIREGRDAAQSIHEYLQHGGLQQSPVLQFQLQD